MMGEMEEHAAPRQWPNVNVPPGYRFKPTPRELIQCYLEPWLATEPGHESPGEFYGIMAAADVYGEDPGTLASRFQHIAHDDGNWYFLSVARWKDGHGNGTGNGNVSSSKQRMNRAVGALGTWHGSGKRIPVRGAGYRQSFEFRPAGGGKTAWLMEEFGTARSDAAGQDGLRVLCRLHLRPKAAAEAAANGEDRQQQQQVEANDDVPAPCNKRRRQCAPARQQVGHRFDADYWTAAPDVGFTSSYATTAAAPAPAPPDVGCSYATTSSHAAGAAAPVTELTAEALATWQHQPMMEQEQGVGGYQYHCAGAVVHGGVYISSDDEPQPLEMVTADMEFTAQDFKMDDSDFVSTVESLLQLDDGWIMGSNSNAFSLPKCDDGVQENNDSKPEPSDGVQETDDDDPKGDIDLT